MATITIRLEDALKTRVAAAPARIGEIVQTLDVLAQSPLIGRAARGYVALYRYVAGLDTVFVLAVRSQRAAGAEREE